MLLGEIYIEIVGSYGDFRHAAAPILAQSCVLMTIGLHTSLQAASFIIDPLRFLAQSDSIFLRSSAGFIINNPVSLTPLRLHHKPIRVLSARSAIPGANLTRITVPSVGIFALFFGPFVSNGYLANTICLVIYESFVFAAEIAAIPSPTFFEVSGEPVETCFDTVSTNKVNKVGNATGKGFVPEKAFRAFFGNRTIL